MLGKFITTISIFSSLTFSASLFAKDTAKVLASVNGVKIYSTQVNEWVDSVVAGGGKDTPELRQTMLNDLVVREAIIQEVKKTGLEKQSANAIKIKVAEQNAMLEIWFTQYSKDHPITEMDIKAAYDQQAPIARDPRNSKEYQLSQIVVNNESEANTLIKSINGGTSFDQLAKERSLEKSSSNQGGLIGWVLPSRLPPPLDNAITEIPKGKVSFRPFQLNNLWYVIKVDDIRNYDFPSYEQAKSSIYQALLKKQKQDAVGALLKNDKVTINK